MYAQSSLWETDELVFSEVDGALGYYDENMNWVAGTPIITEVVGNLQPYQTTSQMRLVLPDGVREEDAYYFYSKDLTVDLKPAKEVGRQLASRTVIDGEEFILDQKGNWSRQGTALRHRAYLLIRLAQDPLAEAT